MKFHKEGYATIAISFLVLFGFLFVFLSFVQSPVWLRVIITAVLIFMYFRIVYFFRVPNRNFEQKPNCILSSADGVVVAIEEVFEEEFLKTNCKLVSVFMSPTNVHINWIPVSGSINYFRYHPGKHLVAWHPKSSTLNERTSIGLQMKNGQQILIRQIAGALARRIVCYADKGKEVEQCEELGFIKFGSRVDFYLPASSQIEVQLNEKVVGSQTIVAKLS
ncbi:MAG: phosphatidylserine decarboxylase family protein [Bacteroidota bacterium]|jgi:phosphatidylserine decarboxylase